MLLLVMFLKGDSLDQIGVTPKVRTKSVMSQILSYLLVAGAEAAGGSGEQPLLGLPR